MSRDGGRLARVRSGILLLLLGAVVPLFPGQSPKPTTHADRKAILSQLEEGVWPLIILGDVNEDGRVDAADAALLEQLARGRSPAAASCPAAADLSPDGKIDQADVAVMRRILAQGSVSVPALYAPDRLACSFKWFALAARPAAALGESNPVYFLDPRFNTGNSRVEVDQGKATVIPMPDGRGYVVDAAPSSAPGGYITLRITLGARGAGGRYYYTFPWGNPLPRR